MKNLSAAISSVLITVRNIKKQKSFLSNHILPILKSAEENNDGSLDENDFKKIRKYYGLAVPAILTEAFCVLHGKTLTDNERLAATAMGALTGLFDDFFDKQDLDHSEIKSKIELHYVPRNQNEKLFSEFYKLASDNVNDPDTMQRCLLNVHYAQIESKKQMTALSRDEIKRITFLKGGNSLLFYRTAIGVSLNEPEEQMLFSAGAMMQLCNDIFDVYKDRESQIHTLVTDESNVDNLRETFFSMRNDLLLKLNAVSLPKINKEKFLRMISLAVFSRTEVCLDQFSNIQRKYGKFNVHTLSRKELICDMDTLRNKIKSVWYTARVKI